MQAVLLSLVIYGVVAGQPKAISNGGIGLAITFIPAILERNYEFPLDPWLGLWITTAVFLHTLGSAGLYGRLFWWDNLTHAMSATVVAGAGYTVARAVDLHSDDIFVPRRFFFVYIFVVVLSFGVIWELFEFALDLIALSTGVTMPLAQHGLDDTVRDLMFNSVGALVVAVFGQAHLSGVAETLRDRLGSKG
ncbi:putative membrane protein [Halanaeroarchaeum sp. HSR-CO]|nr:putative membrane protein [Halanaeroarchaeum sp. HSR-CO]